MNMGIIIRNMTIDDVADVVRLEEICFTSDAWSADSFIYRIENGGIFQSFIAEENGRFCGYIAVSSQFEETYIDSIAIAPEFRRKGIAKRLLAEIEQRLDPQRILLEVRKSNAPARALYESAGFQELAIRKDYYNDPVEDGIIMERLVPAKPYTYEKK